MLKLIARLYKIEKQHKDSGDTERFLARRREAIQILKQLRQLLDDYLIQVTPKSALGKAVAYMDKYWSRLIRYTEWGYLPIDNNRAENAIRPFVVGRKAWLFADTPAGANASAMIFSLIETAKANGIEPYTWLKVVLTQLPLTKTVEEVEALLPWNMHPANILEQALD